MADYKTPAREFIEKNSGATKAQAKAHAKVLFTEKKRGHVLPGRGRDVEGSGERVQALRWAELNDVPLSEILAALAA